MNKYVVTMRQGETKIETVVEAESIVKAVTGQKYCANKLGLEITSITKVMIKEEEIKP